MAQNESRPTRIAQHANASAQTGTTEKSTIERGKAEGRDQLDEIYTHKRRAEEWPKRATIDDSEFVFSGGSI
jgi:hypothetical protein